MWVVTKVHSIAGEMHSPDEHRLERMRNADEKGIWGQKKNGDLRGHC